MTKAEICSDLRKLKYIHNGSYGASINEAIELIEGLAEPKLIKKGEWEKEKGLNGCCSGYMASGIQCSICGEVYCEYIGDYNFCPNCGAEMKRR